MPARKMRIKINNGTGTCYIITFEGRVTRHKAIRLLEIAGFLKALNKRKPKIPQQLSDASKYTKIRWLIERKFPQKCFSSRDIQQSYEKTFKEPIQLSTVSTYLSRMERRGILETIGRHRIRIYKMSVKRLPRSDKQSKHDTPFLFTMQTI